jgi:hypothetical protein
VGNSFFEVQCEMMPQIKKVEDRGAFVWDVEVQQGNVVFEDALFEDADDLLAERLLRVVGQGKMEKGMMES